jgi:hypothetical protein
VGHREFALHEIGHVLIALRGYRVPRTPAVIGPIHETWIAYNLKLNPLPSPDEDTFGLNNIAYVTLNKGMCEY